MNLFNDSSPRVGCDTRSIFNVTFNRFEFRVLLLLDWLPHQGSRIQCSKLFTHSWRGNHSIHAFPKVISPM